MNINAKVFVPSSKEHVQRTPTNIPISYETIPIYDIVIYHGRCPDGIAGAWCYWRINRNAVFHGASHGSNLSTICIDIKGKRVLFIDFVYPKDIMRDVIKSAAVIRVLDHHKTSEYITQLAADTLNMSAVIDMNRSGAQIAWDEFNPTYMRPAAIDYVADKDLYTFKLQDSREINRAMEFMGYLDNIEAFDNAVNTEDDLVHIGSILLRNDAINNKKIADRHISCMYKDYKVCVVQCLPRDLSSIAELLSNICDFVVCANFNLLHDQWGISFRSKNLNLLPIVKEISDGHCGGHPNACGCGYKGNLRDIFKPKLFKKN